MARVNAKESVNTSSKDWMNLMCAIQDENIPLVKILLQRRIGVNMKDERGWSFLLQATNTRSANACYEIIKELLAKGIEVDSQDEHGWTALMIASLKGYHQTIKLLLEYMANVNIRNVDGWSALMFASLKGKNEAAKVLLEYGSNVNEQSIEGQSALMIASRYGHTKTVKLLLDHRARVNDKDSAGWCALMFASRNGHIESVKLLLGLRCNREQPILLNHHYRTDINMQNNSGCTSLIIASQNRQTNIAKCLLQYGADTKIKDNFGQSAIDYATKNGHTELVNLLMCREHVYDHLPNITMTRNSTDPDYDVVVPRHRQQSAPSVNALHLTTQTNKSTCQQVRHSEYNHLPHDEMCLHSTKRNEYDDLVHRPTQKSTFNAPNTNSPSCTQSRRHSIEADRGSFPRPRHSGYDHLTVILTPRSDHALDFENCAISNEHVDMISGSINDLDELVAKQLGLSSDDITTIKKKYPNIKPKLQMKAVLEKWKYEFGNNATYNNLICALEGTGCQWYANIVKRIHNSNTEHVYQSIHFYKAKNVAQVPFLFHKIIDVNHKGLEYTTEDHDITIRIPEGAVPKGRTFHFEIGVTTYGPFNFPEGTRPISPIVWVCIMEENVINFHQLKKKFQLILPHFLRGLNKERLRCHQVHAAKANHNDINQTMYKFNLLECQPLFASPNEYKSYGLIESNHCCFYCLQANQSPELAKDTSYYLVRIESSMSSEIYFVAGFFLNTCIQARNEQFPSEHGYKIGSYKRFKFNEETTKPSLLKIKPQEPAEDQCVIILDPLKAEITETDINFWGRTLQYMRLMHKERLYPPRVKMTIRRRNQDYLKLLIEIRGGYYSEEGDLDMEVCLDGSIPISPLSPSSAASGYSFSQPTENHSKRVYKPGDKPKLSDALRTLLPLADDWTTIGTLLEVEQHVLSRIDREERKSNDCLRQMLSEWFKQIDNPTTWNTLAEAVEAINPAEAKNIRDMFAY